MKLSKRYTLKLSRSKRRRTRKKIDIKNRYRNKIIKTNNMSNMNIIGMLEKMENLMYVDGQPFKARAYSKAKDTIMLEKDSIEDANTVAGKNGFRKGGSVLKTLNEFITTGKVQKIEDAKNDPKHIFTKVYGIGPKMAKKLSDPKQHGIGSIEELREKQAEILNDVQIKGLKYYEAMLERIPRKEIELYEKLLRKIFNSIKNPGSEMQIVGSWRRGAKTSGDIDIIITDSNNDNKVYKTFIDILIKKKILVDMFSHGDVKTLGMSKLTRRHTPRRIDFMFTPKREFTFALLYFTGSKIFNTLMRQRALEMGYTMNEHGIYHMLDKKKGDRLSKEFPTEKSVFDFLGIEFRKATERTDGNSFKLTGQKKDTKKKNLILKKKTEKKALKKKPQTKKKLTVTVTKKNIKAFETKGDGFLKTLSENEVEHMIKVADNYYYEKNKPLLQDESYDALRDWAEEAFPENEIITQGHAGIEVSHDKKVTLPYNMPSMDKIKPDTKVLANWLKKYTGPFVISAKLDGMSALYCREGDTLKLYSRGNGVVGHDISYLLPFLKLPNIKNDVVRGELIISKKEFKKYKKEYANERSFASGQRHAKNEKDREKLHSLDFVAYEIIQPKLKPSAQYKLLKKKGFNTVKNKTLKAVDQDVLSKYLMEWREKYDYIIDGVICIDDKVYERKKGNPAHAFAFKKVMSDQVAESIVVDVLWSKTKYGYVKPKIKMRPVKIGGVKITYATAHNAKFIKDKKIGVGSVIQVVRSGDVIPKVLKVVKPSKQPKMPDESMGVKWNASGVDLILKDKKNDPAVRDKTTLAFFKTISVDGLKEGNLKKIIAAGHDTIGKILEMSVEDFLEIPGFKEKMATKIHDSMKVQIDKVSLPLLMDASNTFGHGMGESRFKLILQEYPNIIESPISNSEKRDMVSDIDGFADITAMKFVKNIREFKKFLKENKLVYKLKQKPKKKKVNKSHPLYDKKILMSGFRDESLAMKIRDIGGEIASSVSKHLNYLVVKDENTKGSKLEKAQQIDTIKIMTKQDFVNQFL